MINVVTSSAEYKAQEMNTCVVNLKMKMFCYLGLTYYLLRELKITELPIFMFIQ